MIVTQQWMDDNYDRFNKMFWNGQLPHIKFGTSHGEQAFGGARYMINLVRGTVIPLSITMSNYYDSPEEVKLDTLLHEMIHIADYHFNPEHFIKRTYSGYAKRTRREYNPHGDWFMSEAKRINQHGFHISTTVSDDKIAVSNLSDETRDRLSKKLKQGCILVVRKMNSDDPSKQWFIMKMDDKMFNVHIKGILDNKNYYSKYFSLIEVYRTFSEKWVKERSSKRSGYSVSDDRKNEIVKNDGCQLLKTYDLVPSSKELKIRSLGDSLYKAFIDVLQQPEFHKSKKGESEGRDTSCRISYTLHMDVPRNEMYIIYHQGQIRQDFDCSGFIIDSRLNANWAVEKYGRQMFNKLMANSMIQESVPTTMLKHYVTESLNSIMKSRRGHVINQSDQNGVNYIKDLGDGKYEGFIE